MLYISMAVLAVLALILVSMFFSNQKLKKEIKMLHEVLELKDTTIANFEASRVAVKDVIDNFSSHEEVMKLVEAGESRENISKKLGIPVSKIELIIKFDKIKKEKHS